MALGVARRRAERLALALLDPQQPGDARLLGLALSTSGQVEAQQRRQRILGRLAVQAFGAAIDQQLAARLSQELLFST